MAKRLTKYVHVVNEGGDNVVLKPGQKVPDWAKGQIDNPKVFEGGDDVVDDDTEPETVVPPADPDKLPGNEPPAPDADYESQTAKALKAEVGKRNEGRADDAKIVVGGKGNKPDLVAALQADDTASA